MGNSRKRRINYKPRYTQMEAYDMLPQIVQRALQEGPQQWDTTWALRQFRKCLKTMGDERAANFVARQLWDAHRREIRNGHCWRDRKPGQKWDSVPLSPHVEAQATMAAVWSKP